jgi:hypothetical protein
VKASKDVVFRHGTIVVVRPKGLNHFARRHAASPRPLKVKATQMT